MITPTIGRVVWFTPPKGDEKFENYSAPFAAIIAYVWSDRCVNLMVATPQGTPLGFTSVTLVQEGDARHDDYGRFCQWMPFQLGQAKKHETVESLAAQPAP